MRLKGEKGTVFLTTMIALFSMIIAGAAIYQSSSQGLYYVNRLKESAQARYLAEAGLAHATAVLTQDFDAKDVPANFPETSLGDGTYDVTVAQSGGRVLLSSVGTVGDVQRTLTMEIEDLTPTALNYGEAAGGDIVLGTILFSDADITGDLFANQDVALVGFPLSPITINGDVYAGGTAAKYGNVTWLSGTSNAGNITFPTYDFNYYRAIAQANGTYYGSSQSWTNRTFNLNTTGGVLFVDGNVTFWGSNNNLTGCLISTGIVRLYGTLRQYEASNYPAHPAIMTEDDDILLLSAGLFDRGKLYADGLVYAGKDFKLLGVNSKAEVTGSVIAKGQLLQGDIISDLDIVYEAQNPPGLVTSGGSSVRAKSYNQ